MRWARRFVGKHLKDVHVPHQVPRCTLLTDQEAADQSTLARAVSAKDANAAALLHRDINALQDGLAVIVAERKVLGLDQNALLEQARVGKTKREALFVNLVGGSVSWSAVPDCRARQSHGKRRAFSWP